MTAKRVTITKKEFSTIKTLIQSFSIAIETIIESDLSHLDKDTELYHNVIDLVDTWESQEIRDAVEVWTEIDR
jgi:hypothetical protein